MRSREQEASGLLATVMATNPIAQVVTQGKLRVLIGAVATDAAGRCITNHMPTFAPKQSHMGPIRALISTMVAGGVNTVLPPVFDIYRMYMDGFASSDFLARQGLP